MSSLLPGIGMLVRVVLACILAAVCGAGLLRSYRDKSSIKNADDAQNALWPNRLRIVCLGICGFWSVVWLIIAAFRLRYPYEVEWIGGAMRDHCMRIVNKQPLYVPPGSGWFPYEYPPVYFWV